VHRHDQYGERLGGLVGHAPVQWGADDACGTLAFVGTIAADNYVAGLVMFAVAGFFKMPAEI
jgi:hypothetical protein